MLCELLSKGEQLFGTHAVPNGILKRKVWIGDTVLLHLLIEVSVLYICIVASDKLVHSLALPDHDIQPVTRAELVILLLQLMHVSNGIMRFPGTLKLNHHEVDQETLKFLYQSILSLKFLVLLLRSCNAIYTKVED